MSKIPDSPLLPTSKRRNSGRLALLALIPLLLHSALVAADEDVPRSENTAEKPEESPEPLYLNRTHLRDSIPRAVRGVTVGPIENALHQEQGYGTAASEETFRNIARMGGTWVSLTPFARVWDLAPTGLDLTFEAPYRSNRLAVKRAIEQAHAAGLKVMLVPHLWVESGEWRGKIDPPTDEGWSQWQQAYRAFLFAWADLAKETHVELLSVGVELRSWVTTRHAPDFVKLIQDVREVYPGPLTYAANWDDVEHTTILTELDVIGINAFYPLAEKDGADLTQLLVGAERLKKRVRDLSEQWEKPILFTEFGYTARDNPAIRPWEWPESMTDVNTNPKAQADAYAALLSSLVDEPRFVGFFVWRFYSEHYDASQEPSWGFNPLHREAEQVLRAAFTTHWAWDGPRPIGASFARQWPLGIGRY